MKGHIKADHGVKLDKRNGTEIEDITKLLLYLLTRRTPNSIRRRRKYRRIKGLKRKLDFNIFLPSKYDIKRKNRFSLQLNGYLNNQRK